MQSVQLFRFVRQRQAGDGEEHEDDGGGKEGRYDGGGGCDGRGSGLVVVVIENEVEIGKEGIRLRFTVGGVSSQTI